MRKTKKLYTANRWNQPLFAQDIDRESQNIFDGLNSSTLNTSSFNNYSSFNNNSLFNNYSSGNAVTNYLNSNGPKLTQPTVQKYTNWGNSLQSKFAVADSQNTVNNFSNYAKSFGSDGKGSGSSSGGMSSGMQAGLSAVAAMAGNIGKSDKYERGLYDIADPWFHVANGKESKVGNALSDAGVGLFQAGASSGNPALMLAGGIVKSIGGIGNALFGYKRDKKKIQAINKGIESLRGFQSHATSFEDIQSPDAIVDNVEAAYYGYHGDDYQDLKKKVNEVESYANRSVKNNIDNIAADQLGLALANYSAFGGPLGGIGDNNSGALNYGFMTDYLTMKNKAAENKNKISTNVFGNLPVTPMSTFALGGDMQTNGSDFTDGLTFINAGGSHEENPNDGVQVGVSRSNGLPNLVEEGETIFDDYVYSKRIKADKQTKERFHIGKNADITFADLSKKLEKESAERPNDAISQAGLTKMLHDLADEQERQKGEEAEDAFAMLPPEQQQAIMQEVAMQEQQGQSEEQSEEPMNNTATQGLEMQGMEEQPQTDNMTEQINACGGKMNRFDKGGDMKRKIYDLLNFHTDREFDDWVTKNKLPKVTDWENILKNTAVMNAISSSNPALKDALSRGYDFGVYTPSKGNTLTFDFTHGGWGKEDYDAWDGSTDAAWQEAVKKGLVKKGMKSKEIGEALMQTDAYKRGTDWLKADENNRLAYLQQILNSSDAPEAARKYAGKYVDSNGWLKDVSRDYQTIFEDPNGTGVRNTHPGTYWKTPSEVLRSKQALNLVVNDDGTVDEIIGDVPKDWISVKNYSWADDKSGYNYNYYKRPVVNSETSESGKTSETEEEGTYEPEHKPTWGRYAGLFGPAVGLAMQAAGVGKPDYTDVDASLAIANGTPSFASYQPIGNYLGYKPMDIWFEQNRLNANSRATDRAIMNNASPLGTKMAGLLANSYNSQIASGDLYRKALEYNDAQRQKVEEFNRGTDMYNSEAFTKTSAANAEIANRDRQYRAQLSMDAARQKMASDAAWNQGIYGNVQGLFKGLSDWGRENEQHNMIADMAADGIFGTMSDKQNIGKGFLIKKKTTGTKKSNGGKINRRKGLTF